MKTTTKILGLLWTLAVLNSTSVFAEGNGLVGGFTNFWGDYSISLAPRDITKPAPDRAYFTTSVEEVSGGAKLTVEIYHGALNHPVSFYLQAAVNDGSGGVEVIPFKQLDDKVADNPNNYYSKREFVLKYNDLNTELAKVLPSAAKHLTIGPGTPLFAYAEFHNSTSATFAHQWGGAGRGGIFFIPETKGTRSRSNPNSAVAGGRAQELDLAYPIPRTMLFTYNDLSNNNAGLKDGGQIRSRVESEGKYQIPLEDLQPMKKLLFNLANSPPEVKRVLGADWTITLMSKYMKVDPSGKMILDADGVPTPNPMIDVYTDNKLYQAAQNDMAIRHRTMEGDGSGAWNYKPGIGNVLPDGRVVRLEFGVDTTDGKPETIKKFVDSNDPLNKFGMIRDIVPGATPSEFLDPSVKLSDIRYKYELKHINGLVVEVSLDDVMATSLRGKAQSVRFGQLEMDIDHLSTTSQNVAAVAGGFQSLSGTITNDMQTFLSKLTKAAFLDGRPIMHTQADLDPSSPVQTKHEADFKLAAQAIEAMRNEIIGKDWLPGAQKYAFAAAALGLIKKSEFSESVKDLKRKYKKQTANLGKTIVSSENQVTGVANCGQIFD